jgi:hypothetical protein
MIKYAGVIVTKYTGITIHNGVDESNPRSSKTGRFTNKVELPAMAKMKKINQNWKSFVIPHLFFNFLNINLYRSVIEQKEMLNVFKF